MNARWSQRRNELWSRVPPETRRERVPRGRISRDEDLAGSCAPTDIQVSTAKEPSPLLDVVDRIFACSPPQAGWVGALRHILFLLSLLLPLPAISAELKVATWNLDWLTTRSAGAKGLPPDLSPRDEDDFARLALYARQLDADLIAIQEVDGFVAAEKIFPRESYSIHMTGDHVLQRVGIVVRRGLRYDINPDLAALATNHLRSGADITLHLKSSDLRVLAVHLKTGCRNQPLPQSHDRSWCGTSRPNPDCRRMDRGPTPGRHSVYRPGRLQPLDGRTRSGSGRLAPRRSFAARYRGP